MTDAGHESRVDEIEKSLCPPLHCICQSGECEKIDYLIRRVRALGALVDQMRGVIGGE